MNISAVVLTKNEEKNIEICLQKLGWCGEIIVVDDESTDNTIPLAKKYQAIVYKHSLGDNFAQQRNFGLEKAKNDWVLFVDADEEISDKLQNEILENINNDSVQGFFLKRKDVMWGKKLNHGEQGNIKLLRLAKKNSGRWAGNVHETWNIKGKIGFLNNPILHYPHSSIKEFLKEINFYSDLRAQELHRRGEKANWLTVLLYTKAKFFQNYILRLGFLDGIEGFIVAILMSFHSFLVRGKLWQLSEN